MDIDHSLPGVDYRPEHRLGDEFALRRHQTRRSATETPNDGSLLYRAIVLDQLRGMEDLIADALPSDEIDRYFTGPVRGAAFIGAIPTAKTLVELEFKAMLNPAYKFRQHDRDDLFALALAVPYADIVLFEAHWTHITSVAKLTDLYRTRLARKPKDLLSMLRQLD